MDGVLVRFGEIGIKSAPVRRMMQSRLRKNLLDMMLRESVEGDVQARGARLWMVGRDPDALADVATRTFGVVSASPAATCEATMEHMSRLAPEIALAAAHARQAASVTEADDASRHADPARRDDSPSSAPREWQSFAVRARRQGKHAFTSQDIGVQVGSAIHVAATKAGRAPRVDLDAPDLEVHVEVRDRTAYIFTQQRPGPGGLPLGSQGTVVALLSDTSSAVAAWLMMRRGCTVIPLHAGDLGSAPAELIEPLQRWGLGTDVTVLPVCGRATTKAALQDAAAQVARELGASAVVTGERLHSALAPSAMPVLRPVMGLAPVEVRRLQSLVGLPDEEGPDLLVPTGGDSSEQLLRMRRVVSL